MVRISRLMSLSEYPRNSLILTRLSSIIVISPLTTLIRKRYCHSKLANIIHARALQDRYNEKGISAYSVHPGVINTNLQNAGQGLFSTFVKYACRWLVIAFIVFFSV